MYCVEDFVAKVGWRLTRYLDMVEEHEPLPDELRPSRKLPANYSVDTEALNSMFSRYDIDGNGTIDVDEFEAMMVDLGVAPVTSRAEPKPELK